MSFDVPMLMHSCTLLLRWTWWVVWSLDYIIMHISTHQTQGIKRFLSKSVRFLCEHVRSSYKCVQSTIWRCSIVVCNTFEREAKRVVIRSQTHSNEETNPYEREVKRVWMRRQMCLKEKPSAFQCYSQHSNYQMRPAWFELSPAL